MDANEQLEAALKQLNAGLSKALKVSADIGVATALATAPKNGFPDLKLVETDVMITQLSQRCVTGVFVSLEPDDAGEYVWGIALKGDASMVNACLIQAVAALNERSAANEENSFEDAD